MAKKKNTKTKKKSAPRTRSRTRPPAKRKKSPKRDRSVVSKKRDKETLGKIELLATDVTKSSLAQRDPYLDIPLRTSSNTKWNKAKRLLEMGSNKQRRNLFNLGQAKKFMQTILLAKGCKDLVEAEKTLSLRGMYYMSLHTIAGTKEKTFAEQGESDTILEDLEVGLDSLREELHVFAKKRGTMIGNSTVIDNGDEINCRRMGTGGYAIPSICEPNVIQFKDCEAEFVLHVEKDTVWSRFNEDRFWETYNCILTDEPFEMSVTFDQPRYGKSSLERIRNRLRSDVSLNLCLRTERNDATATGSQSLTRRMPSSAMPSAIGWKPGAQ